MEEDEVCVAETAPEMSRKRPQQHWDGKSLDQMLLDK